MDAGVGQRYDAAIACVRRIAARAGSVPAVVRPIAIASAIARDPRNAYFHNIRGDLLARACQMEAAVVSFNRAVQLAPHSAWLRYVQSRGLMMAGRLPEAIDAAQQALDRAPDHAEMRAHLEELRTRVAG